MYACSLSDEILYRFLMDDVPAGDLTTDSLGLRDQTGALEFRARGAMTVCGVEEAVRLFVLAGSLAQPCVASGAKVADGERLLTVEGPVDALHRAWKTAQSLMEWASGIASNAAALVRAADPLPVACTRKHVPGAKALSIKAVRAGGAIMHRLGLSETLLVSPNIDAFLMNRPLKPSRACECASRKKRSWWKWRRKMKP